MAITVTHIEGFDDGAAVAGMGRWSKVKAPTLVTSVGGRAGLGNAMRVTDNFTGDTRTNFSTGSIIGTRFVFGLAVRPITGLTSGTKSGEQDSPIVIAGTNTISVSWSTGNAVLRSGPSTANSVIQTSSVQVVSLNTWTYLEFNILQGTAGAGQRIVKADGVEVLNSACTVSGVTYLALDSGGDSGHVIEYDDFYIGTCDASTDFLGDNKVYTLFPNGNGTTSQGIGSDGNSTDNYLLVDETGVSTTDYIDVSVGERELYNMQNLPFVNGTVHTVQPREAMERTDAGSISAQSVVKLGANESTISGNQPPYGSVGHIVYTPQTTKPGGGNWTVADVNNAEFGLEGV